MKLGSAMVVLALGGASAWGLNLGCSHEAKPAVQPDDHPPLPPASGTPIGHLIDNAAELKLSDDQLTKLKAINDELATQLAVDDSELRPAGAPPPPPDDVPSGRGLGARAGGRLQSGASGGAQGFPGAPAGRPGTGVATQTTVVPATTVGAVHQQRAHHVRDAIRRAFAMIDADQQARARRLLADHGIDPDSGDEAGGQPGESTMEDPKLGQPLPREQ